MKKLFNKLSASGNLREEVNIEDDEQMDTHFRKPTTLPADVKDTSEDIKMKKPFSLSKATSPRYKDALEDEFSKKKSSSSGLKKEKTKDKLNESDDKLVRKSKSAKTVSPKKSSDQLKNPNSMRSPSLKSIFSSQYEQQRDGNIMESSSDEEEEVDAFVPHQHPNILDDEFNLTYPIRVPSAPARMASSPSPSHSTSPSPPSLVSLQIRTASPSPANGMRTPTPTTPVALPPSSPTPFSTSPTSRVPAFTQSPPAHALAPKPHLVAADEFDAKFGPTAHAGAIFGTSDSFNGSRDRSESLDHFNLGRDSRLDSVDFTETDEVMHQKKSGLFSFGSNKPTKLKA